MCPAFFFGPFFIKLPTMSVKLARLETLIGHTFQDTKLLERALTHRSWAYENLPGQSEEAIRAVENESLEFVGDSVLGLVVAEQLFLRNPQASEGDLTLMKHSLVSGAALASLGEQIGLGQFVKLGGSELESGRKKQSLLTNTLEAVIGAIFLDGGYIATRLVIVRLMEERLRNATPKGSMDFKSRLQADLQAEKRKPAAYTVVKTEGPPHSRHFLVEVAWEDGKARGEGNSIKAAEMMAAEKALHIIDDRKRSGSK